MANSFALTATRNDTIPIDATITRSGSAVNLTGASFWFTAKNRVTDADSAAVFQKTSASGAITITSASGGTCRVTIAPADTTALADHDVDLQCDLQMKEADGTYTTVASGVLTITPDITRTST